MPDHRPDPVLRWHDAPVERSPIFVVPGQPVGSSSVVPRGKTWGIRERGDTQKLVQHNYRCPVHGVFELRVSVADVPDEVFCPDGWTDPERWRSREFCGRTAHWAGSSCAIGIESGMVTG
jgi:hypothetical protein